MAFHADDNILFFDEYSGSFIFCCNQIGILLVYLNNVNFDDTNYDEGGPETIIHTRVLAWNIKFEKCKAFKKDLNEELMLVVLYPKRWQTFRMTKGEKTIEPIFIE